MRWQVVADADALAWRAAEILLGALDVHPALVLGLPTGRTPEGMYERVAALCRRESHCFAEATSFNLDEYVGIGPEHPGSYAAYMERHLFAHVDLPPARRNLPDGLARAVRRGEPSVAEAAALAAECRRYEAAIRAAGGLSLTFLGLGRNGHIAFNEPGSPFDGRTRVVALDASTRRANAAEFPPGEEVPTRAITMGIGTILESTSIVLLASGAAKAGAVARLRSGEVGEELPASALHRHGDVTVLVDEAAGLSPPRTQGGVRSSC